MQTGRKRLNEGSLTIEQYVKHKIHIIEDHFHIRLSSDEYSHFLELNSEIAVDNFAHKILQDKL